MISREGGAGVGLGIAPAVPGHWSGEGIGHVHHLVFVTQ